MFERITTMRTIYLDNAATSFPKAPGVPEAMTEYLTAVGGNPGRGSYMAATEAEDVSFTLREQLCAFFGSPDAEACVFTPGATYGLNLVLKGYLRNGGHVLVSSVEHNAVMRPLHQIPGLEVEQAPCAADGSLRPEDVADRIRPDTKLVCLTHASNVCGTLLPVEAVGAICAERGVPFVVDAAQTAGHLPLNREAIHADALVVPGHKGLLGPQGIGAVLMRPAFARRTAPLVAGGTGSRSNLETQPEDLPDKFEAGTQNVPGQYGLLAALTYLQPRAETLRAEAMRLCGLLLEGVARLPHARVLGKMGTEGRVAVVAVDFTGLDNAAVAGRLASDFGVYTRCGLHCAPSAHRTLGSFPQGAVRFSVGMGNTEDDIRATLSALRAVVTGRRTFAPGSGD
jgi:cysteine desulfurase family protein